MIIFSLLRSRRSRAPVRVHQVESILVSSLFRRTAQRLRNGA
jgi:hypothetical protein